MFALVCSLLLVVTTAGRDGQAIHAKSPKCKETPYTSKKVADAMSTCAGNVKANIIEEAFTIVRYQWDHLEHEREHEQLVHYSQPHYNTARPPPGIGSDLVRHVHHVHRLPGQLHQHQADYPPFVGLDPRVPAALHRPQKAVGPSTASMDANSYLEYQNFDPDLNVMRRRLDRRRRSLTTSATAPLPGWALGKTTEISMQEKRIAGCLLHCIFSKNNAIDGMGWLTLDGLVSFFTEGVHDHHYFVGTLRAVNVCLSTLSHTFQVKRWRAPERGQSCDLSFEAFNCIADKIGEFCESPQLGASLDKLRS